MDILLSAGVSAVVSGLVAFTAKEFIQSMIQKRTQFEIETLKMQHDMEIVRLKAQLSNAEKEADEMRSRRSQSYPRIGSLVYRIRNMARGLAGGLSISNISLVDEFAARAKELEEALYEFRLDLEKEHFVFTQVHAFKDRAVGFSGKAALAKHALESKEDLALEGLVEELRAGFKVLDSLYLEIVKRLSLGLGGRAEDALLGVPE